MALKTPFRTAGNTGEQTITTLPCFVHEILPELTTTGTITLRNGVAGTIMHVCAIGLTQAGKSLGGMFFDKGLTIQLSVATDLTLVGYDVKP